MTIPYEKYHGAGNEFIIIDANEFVPDRSELARQVCDRTDGVGADGVLFLALEDQYSPPRVIMTLVQPDGSNAAMCGNGARCAAHWAGKRAGADTVMIDTQAGTYRADIDDSNVTIEMGVPSMAPVQVPVAGDEPMVDQRVGEFEVTAVNTGVPHAVIFVDDVAAVDVERVAPEIRHADVFPEGANVTFASPDEYGGFDQRTFERGVEGETQACGTGAVAIAVAAHYHGQLDSDGPVEIHPPGGDLEITLDETGATTLHGPVEWEYDGQLGSAPAPRRLDARREA